MPLIWAAISAHGFGHAAQMVPVLNALGGLVPDLRVLLRTTVSPTFFKDRLFVPWEIHPVQQDVGCIQQDPLTIDIEATWHNHQDFHRSWDERLQIEVHAMRAAQPNLVLADTSYLALAAGKAAAIPSIALMNFTWDLVLAEYPAPAGIDRSALLQTIRQQYEKADLALRITPAPVIESFPNQIAIQPIAEPAVQARQELATILKLAQGERTVLIGFGGIPLSTLPFERLESFTGYRFLFDGPTPPTSTRCISTRSLPLSFKTVLASVDTILTKPGYGTVIEAVTSQIPVIYVRRYNFVDEQPLVDYLHRYGTGIELSRYDFMKGQWLAALQAVDAMPTTATPPLPTGAQQAATILAQYLGGSGSQAHNLSQHNEH